MTCNWAGELRLHRVRPHQVCETVALRKYLCRSCCGKSVLVRLARDVVLGY